MAFNITAATTASTPIQTDATVAINRTRQAIYARLQRSQKAREVTGQLVEFGVKKAKGK
jgi:hypothetical protein